MLLLEQDVSETKRDQLKLVHPPYKRMLDAAIPKYITVAETTQLLVLMRQSDAQELKTITEAETASNVKNQIVQSQPFEQKFPLTKGGQPALVELGLELDAPDFTPPLQRLLIPIPLTGDSQLYAFNISPNIVGELVLTLHIYKGDLCISSHSLRTSSESGESVPANYSEVISILLNVTVERVDQSPLEINSDTIDTGGAIDIEVNKTSHRLRKWPRSLKWWRIGAIVSIFLLALTGVIGSWLLSNMPFSGTTASITSVMPVLISASTLTSTPTHLSISDTPSLLTPIPTDLSENMPLIIVAKLEDRSNGKYQGTDPAQSIYNQIAAQAQKDELALDIRYPEQMPDSTTFNKMGETAPFILVLSGWYDSTTVNFHLEFFAIIDQSNTVQKTDEFSGAIEFPSHIKYLALFALGMERYFSGDDDSSLDYFNNALLNIPGDETTINPGDVYYLRGLVFHGRGERDRAIAEYTQAIDYKPETAEFYNSRGAAEDEMGRYEQAIDDYSTAIQLQPNLAKFYCNRANTYAHIGNYKLAISDYTQAIALEPDYAEAYHYRGLSYDSIGDYVHAIADYTQAIQIQPDYADAYNDRGTAYYNLEQIDQAIADYTQAIKMNPELEEAYNNRGNAYRRQGRYELAIADLNKAIDLDPRDYIAYYNRGLAYEEMGDKEKAIADFKEVLALNPSQEVQQLAEQELRDLGAK